MPPTEPWEAYLPEFNAIRQELGPGVATWLASGAMWSTLASMVAEAAAAFGAEVGAVGTNWQGLSQVQLVAAVPPFMSWLAMAGGAAAANALATNSAYVTTPTVAGLLKGRARISSTDSRTLWEGNILDGEVDGYRGATTTQLTAGSMIFGDYSQVVIGEWGMLEIALNPYANFGSAITGIRAIQSVDVGVRQAAAFSRATSIT